MSKAKVNNLNNEESISNSPKSVHIEFPEIKCGEILLLDEDNFWFVCNFCEKRFIDISKFLNHLKYNHLYTKNSIKESEDEGDPLELELNKNIFYEYNSLVCNEPEELIKEEVSADEDLDLQFDSNDQNDPNEYETVIPPKKKIRKTKTKTKKVFDCNICSKHFRSGNLLKSHLLTHTDPVTCEKCGKQFKNVASLQRHSYMHSQIKLLFKCEVCGMFIRSRSSLKNHMYTHTGERPYKCEMCDKRFASSTTRKVHMRHHTGERPYVCDICGQAFPYRSGYNYHMIRHKGIRNFPCDNCSKSFFDKTALDEHKLSHEGKKKFTCDICSAKFTWKKNLVEHCKIHTEERQHVCELCFKQFKQRAGLYSHMKQHRTKE